MKPPKISCSIQRPGRVSLEKKLQELWNTAISKQNIQSIYQEFPIQNSGFHSKLIEEVINKIDIKRLENYNDEDFGIFIKEETKKCKEATNLPKIDRNTAEKIYIEFIVLFTNRLYYIYENNYELFFQQFVLLKEIYKELLGEWSIINYMKQSLVEKVLDELNRKNNSDLDLYSNLDNSSIDQIIKIKKEEANAVLNTVCENDREVKQDFIKYYEVLHKVQYDNGSLSNLYLQMFIYSILPEKATHRLTIKDTEEIYNTLKLYLSTLNEFKSDEELQSKIKKFFEEGLSEVTSKQKQFNQLYRCALKLLKGYNTGDFDEEIAKVLTSLDTSSIIQLKNIIENIPDFKDTDGFILALNTALEE